MGTAIQRIGCTAGLWYPYKHVQVSMQVQGVYNFKSLGAPKKHWEFKNQLGLLVATGVINDVRFNRGLCNSVLYNTTYYPYAIGYAYNTYWDTKGTSQQTATVQLQAQRFIIHSENDAYAFLPFDRYRTGTLGMGYYINDTFEVGTNIITYTGATNALPKYKDSTSGARYGYVDISKGKYGAYSHGIAYLYASAVLPYYQSSRIEIGVDDERIRHFIQNKIVHDNALVHALNPKVENYQVPMLDKTGMPYLNKNTQTLKPTKFYFQFKWNDASNY